MRCRRLFFAALFVALASAGAPAHACMVHAPLELTDIKYADVVVVGRISNYAIAPGAFAGYARFDVLVDEILVGTVPPSFAVTWDNSTFAEPEVMPSGPFLIALRDSRSGMPPLRGPSATILPNPETGSLTVLQAPCSDAFIFARESNEASIALQILQH